jgi:hypothetical protein
MPTDTLDRKFNGSFILDASHAYLIRRVRWVEQRGAKTWKERGKLMECPTCSHCTSFSLHVYDFCGFWEKYAEGMPFILYFFVGMM